MEDIVEFENRERLYKFLIDDFGLVKVEEKYDSMNFGNFMIKLSAKEFLLRYVNDRSYLTIEISSITDPLKWYDLSFVKDLIYNPDKINTDDRSLDNATRIEELNSFLKKDFDRISELFGKHNYQTLQQQLDELLKQQFKRRFP